MEETMTQQDKRLTCAAIDIGSNTVATTIAHCKPDQLDVIKDESAMLRIEEDVKAKGEISAEKHDALLTTVRKYAEMAKQQEANAILAVATEAMRDAQNNQEVIDEIQRETGVQVNIIPGTIEAALTYHGATYGPDIPPDAAVLDVGGGSSELVTARQRHITWLTSVPIGSSWLHDQYLPTDPPTEDEIEDAQGFIRHYLRNLHVPHLPLTLVVTGSSAKALLKMSKEALKLDEHSDHLTYKDISGCLTLLRTMPAEQAAQRYEMEAERAKVLPGGILLMLEMMAYLHLDEIRISHHGVREGMLLAYARYGEHWLDHADVKVSDDRIGQAPPVPKSAASQHAGNETFVESGHDELLKRAQKFTDWHDDVLKNEDVEAVHKMRVASRRLRATMDAYEPACKSKPFKQIYRQVKEAADLLGAARDIDVMTQNMRTMLEQAPEEEKAGVQWFIDRLSACRKQEQRRLGTYLQNLNEKTFEQKMEACIAAKGGNNG